MKYLKYELYEKICSADGEQYEEEWNKEYSKFLKKLEQISSRLPKTFLLEFEKYYFHDNILSFISIE